MDLLLADIGRWRVRLAALTVELTEAERLRAHAIRPRAGRERAIVARALLRRELAARLGAPLVDELELGEHGKPRLSGGRGPQFNISHAGSVVALVFDDALAVGVDVERVRAIPRALPMAERFGPDAVAALERLAPGEPRDRAFLERWTAHEALGKALGDGVGYARDDPRAEPAVVRPLDGLPDGYVGAVAALGPAQPAAPRWLTPEG